MKLTKVCGQNTGCRCRRSDHGGALPDAVLDHWHLRRQTQSVCNYGFVDDACANGQQLKCLTVINEYTREALAIDVAGSIRSARVIDVLARLVSVRGAPRYLSSEMARSLSVQRC